MRHVRMLFIGGSAFACGYALAHPEETLILARKIGLGEEFTAALHRPYLAQPKTAEGQWLYEETLKWEMRRGEILHQIPVTDLLAVMLDSRGCKVLFQTEVMSIQKQEDGWLVDIWNADGQTQVYADCVVETESFTKSRLPEGFPQDCVPEKYAFCAPMVLDKGAEFKEVEGEIFLHGAARNEIIWYLPLPDEFEDDMLKIRPYLHKRYETFRGKYPMTMGAEGGCVAAIYNKPISVPLDQNYFFCPSASFDHLMEAFEQGVLFHV